MELELRLNCCQTSHGAAPSVALYGPQDENVEVSVPLGGDSRLRWDPPVVRHLSHLPPVQQVGSVEWNISFIALSQTFFSKM